MTMALVLHDVVVLNARVFNDLGFIRDLGSSFESGYDKFVFSVFYYY